MRNRSRYTTGRPALPGRVSALAAMICVIPTVPFARGIAMTRASHSREPPMLVKWRFVSDKKDQLGSEGEARYWWSDGSKSEEKVGSLMEAVFKLKVIQDSGGEKAI
jgi:hypothetical protein